MNRKHLVEMQLKRWKAPEQPCPLPPALLAALRKEVPLCADRRPAGFAAILRSQIAFIGWRIWAGQAFLLLCALLTLWGATQNAQALSALWVPQSLFYLSLLVSGVVLPVLYRSFRYKMHEIETTTYYATTQLLLAKLLVVGIGDLAILGSLTAFIAVGSVFPLGSSVLYLLCPFLLASFGIMQLLGHFSGRKLLPCSAGMYGLLALGFPLLRVYCPMALGDGSAGFWSGLCIVLLVLCSLQLLQLEKRPGFAELQLL